MPVYFHLASIIIDKKAVELKYKGGIAQFRKDYINDNQSYNQEDNELFLIARMNTDEFDIDHLINNGLPYDKKKSFSPDFVIKPRYGNYLWSVDFIEDNNVFAWHKDCKTELINKAKTIGEMTVDDIDEAFKKRVNLFETIK